MAKLSHEEKEAQAQEDFKALFDTPEKRQYWRDQCSTRWDAAPPEICRQAIIFALNTIEFPS